MVTSGCINISATFLEPRCAAIISSPSALIEPCIIIEPIEKIEFIRCMRRAGIPVGTIAEYMKMCAAGDDTIPDRKQLLLREREAQLEKMKQLQECLNRLDCKIETYEAIISGECRGEDSDSSWTSKEVVKRCHKYEKEHK